MSDSNLPRESLWKQYLEGLDPWISKRILAAQSQAALRLSACKLTYWSLHECDNPDERAVEAVAIVEAICIGDAPRNELSRARHLAEQAALDAIEAEFETQSNSDDRSTRISKMQAEAHARACTCAYVCTFEDSRACLAIVTSEAAFAIGTRGTIDVERKFASIFNGLE
jgi:hypothetical protein